MFCPQELDCKTMSGVTYKCPNLTECLHNSRFNKMQAIVLYFLNLGVKPEDIKVDGKPYQLGMPISFENDCITVSSSPFSHPDTNEEQS